MFGIMFMMNRNIIDRNDFPFHCSMTEPTTEVGNLAVLIESQCKKKY